MRTFSWRRENWLHLGYLATIAVKGFDGGLETLLGLSFAIFGPDRIYAFVISLTAPELYENPDSKVMHFLQAGAARLADGPTRFIVTYLLVHGVLKLWLAVTLLRGGGRWLFPLATLILAGFIGFMCYRLNQHWSGWLLGFALFDLLTLALVLNEWRRQPG